MKVDTYKVGSVEVHAPGGPLVEADAAAFTALLSSKLKSACPRLVVEMSEVPYLDSSALDGLLDAADTLEAQNAQLKLAAVTPTCREILEITGLTGHFAVFENVQDAVRSFL